MSTDSFMALTSGKTFTTAAHIRKLVSGIATSLIVSGLFQWSRLGLTLV